MNAGDARFWTKCGSDAFFRHRWPFVGPGKFTELMESGFSLIAVAFLTLSIPYLFSTVLSRLGMELWQTVRGRMEGGWRLPAEPSAKSAPTIGTPPSSVVVLPHLVRVKV